MDAVLADTAIRQIYNAAAGRAAWEDTLATVAGAVGAFAALLFSVDKRAGTLVFCHLGGAPAPAAHLEFIRY